MKKLITALCIFIPIILTNSNAQLAGTTIYGVDPLTDEFVVIDRNTGAITSVGPIGLSAFFNGLAYDSSSDIFYCTDDFNDILLSIDPANGTGTPIGPLGFSPRGLAYDSSTDTLFAVGDDQLFAIDRSTGAGTSIGVLGFSGGVNGITYNPTSDTLFGIEAFSDQLITIDRNTGNANIVGPLGAAFTAVTSLTYDALTDALFAFSFSAGSPGDLIAIDQITGAASIVGATSSENISGLTVGPIVPNVVTPQRAVDLVSISAFNASGNSLSSAAGITPDGRFALFNSFASDLGGIDPNGTQDVYVRDIENDITTRVSVNSAGTSSAIGPSTAIAITPDGRFVLFNSLASDLSGIDNNGLQDVFVRDLQTNTTVLISISALGNSGNGSSAAHAITSDGRYVLFNSFASDLGGIDANGLEDVYIRDLHTNTTIRVSINAADTNSGNGKSSAIRFTPDGRYVLFNSFASDLSGVDPNGTQDVFVRDMQTNTTTLVSVDETNVSANGFSLGADITPDGRYVLFSSDASNIGGIDANGARDVYVRDLQSSVTTRVSMNVHGNNSGAGPSTAVSITPDGNSVLFFSIADNLVTNGSNGNIQDVFVRNLQTNITRLVTVNAFGNSGNAISTATSITPDGEYVLFSSFASDLGGIDPNGQNDVYLRNLSTNTTERLSINSAMTSSGNGPSTAVAMTPDARSVLFISLASDIAGIDPNGQQDVFVSSLPIVNTPPIADAGTDHLITLVGTQVQLDGSLSFDNEGDAITYSWTFVDKPASSTSVLSMDNIVNPTFIADINGTYELSLIVTDSMGAMSTPDAVIVSFNNIQPTADAGGNQNVVVGNTVNLIGSGSDANNDLLTYGWILTTVPAGSTATLSSLNTPTTSFMPDLPGNYVASLVVNDGLIDSIPSIAETTAISQVDDLTQDLMDTTININSIDPTDFRNPNQTKAMTNKINAALIAIEDGDFEGARDKLISIRKKTDGCANVGAPDKNDWILTCGEQLPIYSQLTETILKLNEII
jgi:hypothetical protein